MENNDQYKGINISENAGDIIGVEVSGYNNMIGKNIVAGSGTISVKDERLYNLPTKYSESLKKFTEKINSELQAQIISEDDKKAINKILMNSQKKLKMLKWKKAKKMNCLVQKRGN